MDLTVASLQCIIWDLRPTNQSLTSLHYTTVFCEGDAGGRAVCVVGNVDDEDAVVGVGIW